jgi:hypothetical protein
LASRESGSAPNDGYGAVGKSLKTRQPALGRYQMTTIALIDVGIRNRDGTWNKNNKFGVGSAEEFLADPVAQERALADYVANMEKYLKSEGATRYLGQRIQGKVAPLTVTEPGLVAAGHRYGAPNATQYLQHIERSDWRSQVDAIHDPDRRSVFLAIETRLREFENIPHRK